MLAQYDSIFPVFFLGSIYFLEGKEEERRLGLAQHEEIRARLDTVRAAGSHGSPTQRTERDSFATMYEDRLYGSDP